MGIPAFRIFFPALFFLFSLPSFLEVLEASGVHHQKVAISLERRRRKAMAETVLLSVTECFIYKVPPLKSASGHRAEDWSLANPLFTGGLRVYQNDVILRIAIFTYQDPLVQALTAENTVLFCECFVEVKPGGDVLQFVDAVIDSSRYFVLRIKDRASTKTALIGVGFRERDTAFDFKNVLNDYVRYLDRSATAEKLKTLWQEREHETTTTTSGLIGMNSKTGNGTEDNTSDDDSDGPGINNGYGKVATSTSGGKANQIALSLAQHRDLSFKPGEKITIKSKALSVEKPSKVVPSSSSATISIKPPSFTLGIAPPPPPGSVITPKYAMEEILGTQIQQITLDTNTDHAVVEPTSVVVVDDDEDWGEFGSAPIG